MARSLTHPRHLAATAFVFLLAGGTLGGAFGLASADPDPDAEAFHFASPMAGDVATYQVRDTSGEPRPWDQGGDRTVTVAWLPDVRLMDPDRGLVWTNTVRVRSEGAEVSDMTHHLVPGTAHAIGSTYLRGETQAEDGTVLEVGSTTRSFHERADVLPCGVRTALQGRSLELVRSAHTERFTCRASGVLVGEGHRLALVANDTRDGVARVLVEATNDRRGEMLRYWFEQGIPYPVRVEEHDDGLQRVWTLIAFERGDEEVRDRADALPAPLPPLEYAPRTPWGIDTSGVAHGFPPDEAWGIALEDPQYPALRDFLAEHPQAYVAASSYQNLRSEGRDGDWDTWRFKVTDGKEMLDMRIRRIQDNGPLGSLVPRTSYDYSDGGVQEGGGYPRRADLPDRLPTWASMLRQWEAFREADYRAAEPNYLDFDLRCHEGCSGVEQRFSAGHIRYDRTYEPGPLGDAFEDRLSWSELDWRAIPGRDDYTLDRPQSYHEQTQLWYPEASPRPAGAPDDGGQAAPVATPLAVASVWAMPDLRQAAAAGIGAAVLSLLYLLHPLAKTGVVGLFSRLRRNELLENPQRRRLMERIEAEPGVHHQELVRTLEAGKGAAEHHLRKLSEGGLIVVHRSAGYTCYFPRDTDRNVLPAAAALKSPVARRIVGHVRACPDAALADVRRALGVSPSTMHHHMTRLQAAGVLETTRAGNGRRLRLTPVGHAVAS